MSHGTTIRFNRQQIAAQLNECARTESKGLKRAQVSCM